MAEDIYFPIDVAERLVRAARNHFERQARWVDPAVSTAELLTRWVEDLERTRVQPSPTPERGDLLVKQDRGELWLLTPGGWRELAPIELQTDVAAERLANEADRIVEQLHGHPGDAAKGVQSAGPPWPLFVQDVLDDLAERSVALTRAAEILTEDETVAERDLVDGLIAYADGLDRGRKMLLAAAIDTFFTPTTRETP